MYVSVLMISDLNKPLSPFLKAIFATWTWVSRYQTTVSGPIHRFGKTLDLVITPAPCQLDSVTVDPAGML